MRDLDFLRAVEGNEKEVATVRGVLPEPRRVAQLPVEYDPAAVRRPGRKRAVAGEMSQFDLIFPVSIHHENLMVPIAVG